MTDPSGQMYAGPPHIFHWLKYYQLGSSGPLEQLPEQVGEGQARLGPVRAPVHTPCAFLIQ